MHLNMDRSKIHVQRVYKREIVKAVIELEKKGFECIAPIKYVIKNGKGYINTNDNGRKRRKFHETYERNYYEVYMRKVQEDEENNTD